MAWGDGGGGYSPCSFQGVPRCRVETKNRVAWGARLQWEGLPEWSKPELRHWGEQCLGFAPPGVVWEGVCDAIATRSVSLSVHMKECSGWGRLGWTVVVDGTVTSVYLGRFHVTPHAPTVRKDPGRTSGLGSLGVSAVNWVRLSCIQAA